MDQKRKVTPTSSEMLDALRAEYGQAKLQAMISDRIVLEPWKWRMEVVAEIWEELVARSPA